MTEANTPLLLPQPRHNSLTRRELLQRLLVVGISLPVMPGILAACLSDSDVSGTPTTDASIPDDPATPDAATTTPEAVPTSDSAPTQPADADPSPTESPTLSISSGTVVIATVTGDTGIGNPILTGSVPGIEYYVFNRLFVYDDNGVLQPELAAEWSYSDDNRELTLALVETEWHDGAPFSADDVIFTFDTVRAESTQTNRRSNLRVGGEYITWEKVDHRTVRITTPQPSAPLLYQLNQIAIIPQHLLSTSQDVNVDAFNRNPVGTGAYRLAEWLPDSTIRLEAHDQHFRGAPSNAGLTFAFYPNSEEAARAIERGDIDMMFAPTQLHDVFDDLAGVTLYRYVYFTPVTLAFHHRHPLLSDVQVRRAIALAIDRERLADEVTEGQGTAAYNQYAATGPLDRFNDYDAVTPTDADTAAANGLLDELGYEPGDDGIRRTPDGERLSFNLITYSGFPEYETAQSMLGEMLAEVGIEVTPLVVDFATLQGLWADPNDPPSNRALELQEWPHPFEFDPDVYNELHSDNFPPGFNSMWFSDPEVNELIELGRTTTDADERIAIYKQLDVRRAETVPSIPLYNALDAWVVSDRVQGVRESTYFRRYVLTNGQHWFKDE